MTIRCFPRSRQSTIPYPATLDLSFIGRDTLDPRITFTRTDATTCATYFDSTGVLRTVAANVPRFDYNPSTLAARGLVIEESRANLVTYSSDIGNGAWTKQASVSVATDTTVAPDGTTSGDTITADNGFGIYQNVTGTIGTAYCHSVFIKAGTATQIMFRADPGAGRHIVFNPVTGAITSTSGTLITSGSQAVGNGWWRFWFAYTTDSTTVRAIIRPDSAGAGQTFIVWGAQTEAGAFPTSYIPTTTTALTRSADVASVNTLSPWYNGLSGTLFAQCSLLGFNITTGLNQNVAYLTDGTNTNRIGLWRAANTQIGSSTAYGSTITGAAWTSVTSRKLAIGYESANSAFAENGSVSGTAIGTTLQINDRLVIGARPDGIAGYLNGWMERISYYPTRLINTDLQAITA